MLSSHIAPMCMSSDYQFGFKTKHRIDMYVFLQKQVVLFYSKYDIPVYDTFLDTFMAYDRLDHYMLLRK